MKDYNNLSSFDGEQLVKTARNVVTRYLKDDKKINLDEQFKLDYSFNTGIFVTINKKNQLRGCIGYPLPDKKLHNALVDAAISAATQDPRFESVKAEELDNIVFEVTILTPPETIQVESPQDYPSKIKVGRDGLIVKQGFYSGLLLPQVPIEWDWNEEQFLGHTCEKAGLPADCWKDPKTEIQRFEGIVFKEEAPNGGVVQKKL